MQMTMTADEVRDFMDELYTDYGHDPHVGMHVDFIGFIVGESYRHTLGTVGATSYRCIHRTPCYATFEAVDPWTGETVRFRRRVRVVGGGEPTAWIGFEETCTSPFGDRNRAPEYIQAADIV